MAKSILLVDDTRVLAESIADMLRMESFDVTLAANGMEALEIMNVKLPNLIISDLRMPVMDGIEFIKAIRSHTVLKSLPVIILSAQTNEESRQAGLLAGANIFLTKPFEEDELLSVIKQLLHE